MKPFNEAIKRLKTIIRIESNYRETIAKALTLHSMVHLSQMSGSKQITYEDNLWDGLDDSIAKTAVNKKGRTIAFGIWHSTRIEDITLNLLINNSNQVLDPSWMKKINSSIPDTGNQLSKNEILTFSRQINIKELKNYRVAVGRKTQKTIKALQFSDFKRKFSKTTLARIFKEKAVSRHPDARWLIDFWSKKDVAGIIFMPITRHNLVHINESVQAKQKGIKKNKE